MSAYYNEHDPYAAQWLRNLIAAGLIPAGDVDERDMRLVQPDELVRYTQCHFFAGIGIWPYALRRAGWSDDRPIWTGSCPCQPFSNAGRGDGFDDERHLWPHWYWLISQCRPPIVAGEQVASKDGLVWLDLVSSDMEGQGYAFGAADLCAAGVGMDWNGSRWAQWLQRAIHDCADPVIRRLLCDFAGWAGQGNICDGGKHIRPRFYFVSMADAGCRGLEPEQQRGSDCSAPGEAESQAQEQQRGGAGDRAGRAAGWLADRDSDRRSEAGGGEPAAGHDGPVGDSAPSRLGHSIGAGLERHPRHGDGSNESGRLGAHEDGSVATTGLSGDAIASDGGWATADWLFCRDGSWRAVEPGTFPLDHAVADRVGKLRAYGNALDGETARFWVETFKELIDGV